MSFYSTLTKQAFVFGAVSIFSLNIAIAAQTAPSAAAAPSANNTNPIDAQTTSTSPANPHNPNSPTLLDGLTPNDSELSKANTELLAKNAELSRQVDNLSTQVNVLTQERSGQLFTYGAITAVVCLIIGFLLARLIGRKDRW